MIQAIIILSVIFGGLALAGALAESKAVARWLDRQKWWNEITEGADD